MRLRKPSPALLVALLALFVALGGPAQAARLINGKSIRKGTVSSAQLKDKGIASRDLGRSALTAARYTPNNSVSASKIRKDGVAASEIKAKAVGSSELASSAVSSLQVADNSLLAQDLATGSVGSDEITDGAVKGAELGTSAVTKSKLGGSSVGESEVANGTLTGRDIGAFSGKVGIDLPAIPGTSCVKVATAAQPPLNGAQNIQDDTIILGRVAAVPPTVILQGEPIDGNTSAFNVVACNAAVAPSAEAKGLALPFLTVNP